MYLKFSRTFPSTNTKLDCNHLCVAAQILRLTSYSSCSDITRSMAAIGIVLKTRNISECNEKSSAKIGITANRRNSKVHQKNSRRREMPNIII